MTKDEMIAVLGREIMSLASSFEYDNYSDAIDEAERDCGWDLPQSTAFKIKWLKQRAKRHLYSFLQGVAANKFQFEQIHLENKFENLSKLIRAMDIEFNKAIGENPEEFAGVDAFKTFGTKIDAGFQYDTVTGEDTTYEDTNEVIFNPTEFD